jgi:hypothetical protein
MTEAARVIRRLSPCVWLCISATAFAQEPGPELRAGGQLYLHSIGLPKEAKVCERYIPGYRTIFDPLYTSWKERHQELMARGGVHEGGGAKGRQAIRAHRRDLSALTTSACIFCHCHT